MIPATIRVYQSPSVMAEILNTKEDLDNHAAAGYFPLPAEAHLAANAKAPAADSALRTDGPTLKHYIHAGYPADAYPPKGYAPREDLEADAKLDAELQAQAEEKAKAGAAVLALASQTPVPVTDTPPEGKPAIDQVTSEQTTPPDAVRVETGKAPAADSPKPGGKTSAKG